MHPLLWRKRRILVAVLTMLALLAMTAGSINASPQQPTAATGYHPNARVLTHDATHTRAVPY